MSTFSDTPRQTNRLPMDFTRERSLGDAESSRLLILLCVVLVQQGRFHFVFALGPTVGRRKIEGRRAAAWQFQRFLETWSRPGLLPRYIFKEHTSLNFDLAWSV